MKEDHRHSPPPHLSRITMGFLAKLTSTILLFSIGYTLGYLSSSYSSSSPSSTNPHLSLQLQSPTCLNTTTTNNSTIIPTSSTPPPLTKETTVPPSHDLFRFRTQCSEPIPETKIRQTILDQLYDSESPYNNFPSQATADLLLPAAAAPRGWGSTTPVFADLISTVRPRTIIELGTFLGASALHMASLTRNLSTLILCVDDFRGWPGARRHLHHDLPRNHHADALLLPQFMLGVSTAGETERIIPVPFSTGSSLAALCEWGVYADLIEVDAGHDFHSAWADINMAYAVLRPGGVLFGHDYFTKADNMGVRRAVTLFARVKELTVRPHGQHWVLSPKPQA